MKSSEKIYCGMCSLPSFMTSYCIATFRPCLFILLMHVILRFVVKLDYFLKRNLSIPILWGFLLPCFIIRLFWNAGPLLARVRPWKQWRNGPSLSYWLIISGTQYLLHIFPVKRATVIQPSFCWYGQSRWLWTGLLLPWLRTHVWLVWDMTFVNNTWRVIIVII